MWPTSKSGHWGHPTETRSIVELGSWWSLHIVLVVRSGSQTPRTNHPDGLAGPLLLCYWGMSGTAASLHPKDYLTKAEKEASAMPVKEPTSGPQAFEARNDNAR